MTPLFTVTVHDIDSGGLARAFELPVAWLARVLDDTDVEATEPGHADVRLSRSGSDVVVRGTAKAALMLPCARCLAPTHHSVTGELSLVLRPARVEHATTKGASHGGHGAKASHAAAKDGSKKSGKDGKDASKNGAHRRPAEEDEYEFTSEEADQDVYDGETVVLDDFLREALLLEVPSFPLCSEDCPGIRPAQRNEPQSPMDPRLVPLAALKTKLALAQGPSSESATNPEGGESKPGEKRMEPVRSSPRPAARPRLQAHRTKGALGAKTASKKAKSKAADSRKKAK
ncbi:MAG: DUF177 domain-containing protein [Polyangiaceae bacterium]|nr:DUF177 domain-containing protein [Polyangiaceae bacterium]